MLICQPGHQKVNDVLGCKNLPKICNVFFYELRVQETLHSRESKLDAPYSRKDIVVITLIEVLYACLCLYSKKQTTSQEVEGQVIFISTYCLTSVTNSADTVKRNINRIYENVVFCKSLISEVPYD